MRGGGGDKTYHRNRTAIEHEERRAARATSQGMKPGSKSSGATVTYCSACGAPMVDSPAGRRRHALRGGKCAELGKLPPICNGPARPIANKKSPPENHPGGPA